MELLLHARPVGWLLLLLLPLHTSALRRVVQPKHYEDREQPGNVHDLSGSDPTYKDDKEYSKHHWWPEFGDEPWHLGYGALLEWVKRHNQAWTSVVDFSDAELQMATHGTHTTPSESNETGWYEFQTAPVPMPANLANITGGTQDHLPALKFAPGDMGYASNNQVAEGNKTLSQPCPLALATSWSYEVVRSHIRLLAEMLTIKGVNVAMGPSLNVMRSPYSGRSWESIAGEDPFLGGRLAGLYITELQHSKIMAALKYFAFHDHEEDAFNQDAVVDDHTAHELYLLPWQMAIEMGLAAVMCSPKKVNGTHACENYDLLTRTLKTELGFKGMVIAGPGAWTNSTAAFRAGADLLLPVPGQELQDVVTDDLKSAAENIIASMIFVQQNFHVHHASDVEDKYYGCFPPSCEQEKKSDYHEKMSVIAPTQDFPEMTVLLKNENNILPLPANSTTLFEMYGSIGVFGRGAKMYPGGHHNDGDYFSGGGDAYNVHGGLSLFYNVSVRGVFDGGADGWENNLTATSLCIVATGAVAAEGSDRRNLLVDDNDLIFEVAKKCHKTVVLLWVPGPVLTPWRNKVDAIITSFYLGEMTAQHYGDLLFRPSVSPSGKLPVSFPVSEDDVPQDNGLEGKYEEHMSSGYRSSKKAAFPFGHGLSYASWQYDNITTWPGGGELCTRDTLFMTCGCATIQVNVTNLSPVEAKQVIQAYVDFGLPDEPKLLLRGFQKTKTLVAGPNPGKFNSSQLVRIYMQQRDVSIYDPKHGWVPQKKFKVRVGTSSADILKVLDVESVC